MFADTTTGNKTLLESFDTLEPALNPSCHAPQRPLCPDPDLGFKHPPLTRR